MLFASWRCASVLLMLLGVASGIRTAKPVGPVGGISLLSSVCRAAVVLLALIVWGVSAYMVMFRRSRAAEDTSRAATCLRWGSRLQVLPMTVFALGLVLYIYSNHMSCTQYKSLFHLDTVHCDDEGEAIDVFNVAIPASALASSKPGVLPGGLPKIIHQTGPSTSIHPTHLKWLKSWKEQNPGWLHVFWTDAEIRKFMASKHPNALEQFDAYPMTVMRIDMFRAYVLYTYGGVYADVDYEALAPLEPVLRESALSLVESPFKWNEDVQNSFMVSSPGHPFWRTLFAMMRQRYQSMPPLACQRFNDAPGAANACPVLSLTGPGVLTDALKVYGRGLAQDAKATHAVPRGAVVLKIAAGGKTLLGSNATYAGVQWDIQPVANHAGMYTVKNAESGFYLNNSAAGISSSRGIQWEIQAASDGAYTFKNLGTRELLSGGSNGDHWQIEANAARFLPSGPFMFGKAFPNGQPGVAAHHFDDTWLTDIKRHDIDFKVAMCCSACTIWLALWFGISFILERHLTASDKSSGSAISAREKFFAAA